MALPTFVSAGAFSQGTAAITPALPASILTNDILLLFLQTENQAITIPTPNGGTWTEVTGSPQGTGTAGSGGDRLTVFWSRYNGTQGAPTTSSSGDHQKGCILAYRLCITSGNPWDTTAGSVAAAATTAVSVPTVTTSLADCLAVFAASNTTDTGTTQFTTWTNASLTTVTSRVGQNSTTGLGGGVYVGDGGKATAGVVSASTATLATASLQGRLMIALKPTSNNVTVTPGLAAVVFAGFAATVKLAINALAGTASVVFSGFAPTVAVSNHQVVTPGTSGVVYTGQSPAVVIGAATIVQPGTAAVTYAGFAPTVLVTVKIPVGLGQVVYTGLASTVAISNNQRPSPGTGQVVFTGFAPSVVAAVTAKPGTGNVTYGGFSPAVVLSDNQIVTTSLGQVTYTSFAPTALIGTGQAALATPGRAQIVFTGFAPSVTQPLRPAIARSRGTTPIRSASTGTTGIRTHAGTSVMDNYRASSNDWLASSLAPKASASPIGT